MRILLINKFLYPKGGAETYMFQLSKALEDKGIDIEYWGMQDNKNIVKDTYNSFAKNVSYHKRTHSTKLAQAWHTIYSSENKKRISIILDAFQPDLVHLHNYNFQLTPSILPEIKKRGIKIVQTIHDSQMVCPYHRLYNFQKDTVCTKCVSGSFFNCINDRCFDGSFSKSLIGAAESHYYHRLSYYEKYIDQFISPSHFLAGLIQKRLKNKPFEIIPNFTEKLKDVSDNKGNYYLYYGRISNEKGILELTEVFKELPLQLMIIGKGELENVLKKNIENIDNIQFLGSKFGEDLFNYVSGARYVIQPSKWYENCPMTVIEAFTYGTPVIASNHSGFKDLIKHEQTGFLLNFKDLNKLKEQFLKIDQIDTDQLKQNIGVFYRENLQKDIHISKIIKVYQQVLEE